MSTAGLDDNAAWYAIRTKPKEEDRADINLRTWQVQTFAPKLRELHASGQGGKYVIKPLFSSYIFAHFNAGRQLHLIKYTRGVQNVVSFGGNPISIDDKVIGFIRAQLDEDGFIRRHEELKPGDRVRINSGPFENLVGIFMRKTKDKDRVTILLDALTYQSHLLIDREMVEKASEAYAACAGGFRVHK
jgi:transcriptional antiterminator RfaH